MFEGVLLATGLWSMAQTSKLAPVHHGVKIRFLPSPSPVPHIQRYVARPNVNQALNEKHCMVRLGLG